MSGSLSQFFMSCVADRLAVLEPDHQARFTVDFAPHKVGKKTLLVDFDCSLFRDIKGSCTIDVQPKVSKAN